EKAHTLDYPQSSLQALRTLLVYDVFVFFLYLYLAHRDLHSFPTRRSSDLCEQLKLALQILQMVIVLDAFLRETVQRVVHSIELRSEEHTSELQSLRHLVCRLLLEKKKHNE